jgi:hypothetical protein
MGTARVLLVAVLGLAIGCGSAKDGSPAPDDTLEFAGGEVAQKIGVERWVLHGTHGQGEISGFDSPASDQGKTVVHALFSVDAKGVAKVDFDLPEAWHASVSPDGSADTGGDPPASAVLALLSSFADLPMKSSSSPTGLVAQAMAGRVRPLVEDSPRDQHLVACWSDLLPGITTYAELQQAYEERYGFCDHQANEDRYVGYKWAGTALGETAAGKLCDAIATKSAICQNTASLPPSSR